MEYHYVTHYVIHLCEDYMKHDNVYDRFTYKWEEDEGGYLITFLEFKDSIRSLANSPKPVFFVKFEDMEGQTGIHVQFLKGILDPVPFVNTKDIDLFWKKKLDAKKVK